MKLKTTTLIFLLSVGLFGYSQNKIVELPLTLQTGKNPLDTWGLMGIYGLPVGDTGSLPPDFPRVSKFPEGLTDMICAYIETDQQQNAYQNYLTGKITKESYESVQVILNWKPDTANLSKTPIKTVIALVYGKDSAGNFMVVIDANNNLDLSDDEWRPIYMEQWETPFFSNPNIDSLMQIYAVDATYEIFIQNKVVPITSPRYIVYVSKFNTFMSNLPTPYATTEYEGKRIIVSRAGHRTPQLAFITNSEEEEFIGFEKRYNRGDYIEIGGEIYKYLEVNVTENTLVLEKIETGTVSLKKTIELSEIQVFSTKVGDRPFPFQEEEFTTKELISLDNFKGKYVLLDFFGTWCGPCIDEIPYLKELYSKTDRAKFEIIAIAARTPADALRNMIDIRSITWKNIMSDRTNRLVEIYGIERYPTTILIDPDGGLMN
jgi:thiol-disulfide isomerase/thioredoxin